MVIKYYCWILSIHRSDVTVICFWVVQMSTAIIDANIISRDWILRYIRTYLRWCLCKGTWLKMSWTHKMVISASLLHSTSASLHPCLSLSLSHSPSLPPSILLTYLPSLTSCMLSCLPASLYRRERADRKGKRERERVKRGRERRERGERGRDIYVSYSN